MLTSEAHSEEEKLRSTRALRSKGQRQLKGACLRTTGHRKRILEPADGEATEDTAYFEKGANVLASRQTEQAHRDSAR